MIRNSWYVADFGRNFKFELQKKVITGLPIVMWRTLEGEVVAFDGRCPHKGFPLWESNLHDAKGNSHGENASISLTVKYRWSANDEVLEKKAFRTAQTRNCK